MPKPLTRYLTGKTVAHLRHTHSSEPHSPNPVLDPTPNPTLSPHLQPVLSPTTFSRAHLLLASEPDSTFACQRQTPVRSYGMAPAGMSGDLMSREVGKRPVGLELCQTGPTAPGRFYTDPRKTEELTGLQVSFWGQDKERLASRLVEWV
ncbi:unnamed protein product [Protopolystoma xenopodis]|uniref:Uncharacterized protein n=1 Tax=Protopolystoma xenopodis TaxID=117903 RepID=A0A3S5BTM2_9PLAT|nr:unnamed protein product [Protopolystoma xenopodis]